MRLVTSRAENGRHVGIGFSGEGGELSIAVGGSQRAVLRERFRPMLNFFLDRVDLVRRCRRKLETRDEFGGLLVALID